MLTLITKRRTVKSITRTYIHIDVELSNTGQGERHGEGERGDHTFQQGPKDRMCLHRKEEWSRSVKQGYVLFF